MVPRVRLSVNNNSYTWKNYDEMFNIYRTSIDILSYCIYSDFHFERPNIWYRGAPPDSGLAGLVQARVGQNITFYSIC